MRTLLQTNIFNLKPRKFFAWDIWFDEPSRNGGRTRTFFNICKHGYREKVIYISTFRAFECC